MERLDLRLTEAASTSTIFFGEGLFPLIGKTLSRTYPKYRFAVIADGRVAALFGEELLGALNAEGLQADLLTFPPGEASKSRQTKAALEDELFRRRYGRDTVVVALGGGVTGDLAGFVAATFCRGVPLVQVPTTVLAMADSSVGGKTGIDVPAGKNLVGAFHQPRFVFMDPLVLRTLPEREFRSGFVEVIKHGLIRDRKLFQEIAAGLPRLRDPAGDPELFNRVLFRSCAIKADIVSADEREDRLRQILNFGHTAGHALERASHWELLHGEAVSVGIVAALRLSCLEGYLAGHQAAEAEALLAQWGTPVRRRFSLSEVLAFMRHDKKSRQGEIRFVLLKEIGSVVSGDTLPVRQEHLKEALTYVGGC